MPRLAALALVAASAGCGVADQPDSIRTVAAVEIPLRAEADRRDLVAILRRHAAADGDLHVDDVSEEWRRFQTDGNMLVPSDRGTIFVGVWRGANDDDPEAGVDDRWHPGRAWLDFVRGRHPERSAIFRRAVLADVYRRWPDAKALPVLPSGGLALAEDLRMTKEGYRIAPDAAAHYDLPPSSPLIAHE